MRALPLLFLLLAACGPSRTTKFRLEPMRGVGGAWQRVIKGKEIRIETQGKNLRVRHGPHNFKLMNVGEFDGDYTYSTFEIRGGMFNVFYSPKGLTVRYMNRFHHWEPTDLPTDLLIVIDGVDMRLEGIAVEPW